MILPLIIYGLFNLYSTPNSFFFLGEPGYPPRVQLRRLINQSNETHLKGTPNSFLLCSMQLFFLLPIIAFAYTLRTVKSPLVGLFFLKEPQIIYWFLGLLILHNLNHRSTMLIYTYINHIQAPFKQMNNNATPWYYQYLGKLYINIRDKYVYLQLVWCDTGDTYLCSLSTMSGVHAISIPRKISLRSCMWRIREKKNVLFQNKMLYWIGQYLMEIKSIFSLLQNFWNRIWW